MRKIAVLLLFFGLSFTHAGAQELAMDRPPEELLFEDVPVVTAAKRPQKRSEAPATIVVITSEDIKTSGARTIAEAVQYRTGINVFGLRSINIRGVGSGSRILLLVDGRRANDVFTGGFEDGFERPILNVERIEVLKGPASAVYGTNAFAGIINVITKKAAENQGFLLRASGGNLSTQKYEALLGTNVSGVNTLISLSAFSDDGSGFFGTEDETRAGELFGKLEWNDLVVSAGYRPNRVGVAGIPGALEPTFTRRRDAFGHVRYQRNFNENWIFASQFQVQHEDIFLKDPVEDFDAHDLRIEGEGWLNYQFNEKDNLTAGVEIRRDRTENVKNSGTEEYTSTNRSFFIENELRPISKLALITGVRADYNTVFGSTVNPRAGIIARPNDRTTLKLFYGRAFRGPEFLLLFTDLTIGSFVIQKNPALDPETVNNLEAYVHYRPFGWLEGRFGVFRNTLHDLISTTVVGTTFTFENVGKASANGFELGAGAETRDLRVFANYTFQKAEDEVHNRSIVLIPRNTINCGITYHSPKEFTISFYGKYVGRRPTADPLTGRSVELDRYFKSDIIFSAPIATNLEFSAAVYNVFSASYERDVTSPQRGIQAVVGLEFHAW